VLIKGSFIKLYGCRKAEARFNIDLQLQKRLWEVLVIAQEMDWSSLRRIYNVLKRLDLWQHYCTFIAHVPNTNIVLFATKRQYIVRPDPEPGISYLIAWKAPNNIKNSEACLQSLNYARSSEF
jgi:hypothetical protein